jgi:hypothetical protein
MPQYRVHFLNHADDVFGTDHFESEHDEAAIAYAATVCRSGIGKGYEIWQDDRYVHTEIYR